MNTFGERVIFLRETLDLSQVKLAEKIGITKMTLYKYEKNICEPRGETIARMADALNTTTDFLLGRTNVFVSLDKNSSLEKTIKKEIDFIHNYKRLSARNQAKIDERIQILLEEQQ